MSDNSSGDDDDDITPVFAFRADDILKKQREAYEAILKKAEEEETAKAVKDKEQDLLLKIREKLKRKPRAKRKANVKPSPPKTEEKVPLKTGEKSLRRSNRQRKKKLEEVINEVNVPKEEEPSPINLSASAKRRLLRIDLKNKRERRRVEELNRRVLSKCYPSSADDQNTIIDIETEQNITLKISYLSEISKTTVSEKEKFSSIISKVADLFNLKIAEVTLCLRDEIINLDATPHSLKIKAWEIIECIPYQSTAEMLDDENSNKIVIKMQSNDSKKKTDIYAHKLEKFQDIMERYANLRSLPLKDLIFEFDGERISASDTPNVLDMESGSCVDVKVIGSSLKPTSHSIPFIDLEKEEPPHKMLNVCVLD